MITFKPLSPTDLPHLFAWLQQPHVKRWWPEPNWQHFLDKYTKKLHNKHVQMFIAHADNTPIGFIQYYSLEHEASSEIRAHFKSDLAGIYGLDLFIGESSFLRKGYGTFMLTQFIHNFLSNSAQKIVVDPETSNTAAISFYEKMGFKKEAEIETTEGKKLLMTLCPHGSIHSLPRTLTTSGQ